MKRLFPIILILLFGFLCDSSDSSSGSGDGNGVGLVSNEAGNFIPLATAGGDDIAGKVLDTDGDGVVDGLGLLGNDEADILYDLGTLDVKSGPGRNGSFEDVVFTFADDADGNEYAFIVEDDEIQIVDTNGNIVQFVTDNGAITGIDTDGDDVADDGLDVVTGNNVTAAYYANHPVFEESCLYGTWTASAEGDKDFSVEFGDDNSLIVQYTNGSSANYAHFTGTYSTNGRHILMTYEEVGASTTSFADAESNVAPLDFQFAWESDGACTGDYVGFKLEFSDDPVPDTGDPIDVTVDADVRLFKRFDAVTGTLDGRYSFLAKRYAEIDGVMTLQKTEKFYAAFSGTNSDDSEGTTILVDDSLVFYEEDLTENDPATSNYTLTYGLYQFDGSALSFADCTDDTYSSCSGFDTLPGELVDEGDFLFGLQFAPAE